MPLPNEHACRLRDPGDFQADSFRRTRREHEGKEYSIIMGRLKGETTMTEQAFRYEKDNWDADQARSHCEAHDGSFEAASEEGEEIMTLAETREQELESLERYRKGVSPAPMVWKAGFKRLLPEDQMMVFVASEESEDRVGDIIVAQGWELKNFKQNPVFLYLHDPSFPPLGTWPNVRVEDKQLLASPSWDPGDEFAQLIKGKYDRNIMRAVSVGFRVIEYEERQASNNQRGILFKKTELVEISAVPVPAHPNALRRALGIRSHFWMPSINMQQHADVLYRELTMLRHEADELLSALTNPVEADWSEVLKELSNMNHT